MHGVRHGMSIVVALALALVLVGPGAAADPASPDTPAGSAPPASGAVSFRGVWEGDLTDPSGSYPIRVILDGCATDGQVCGEIEYSDPSRPDFVFCASELSRTGLDGDALSLTERLVYRPRMCLETAFTVRMGSGGRLEVEQLVGPTEICCRGTLDLVAAERPPQPTPASVTIEGLGRTTASVALGDATTQYVGVGDGSLWFPLVDTGRVARIDGATGEVQAIIEAGDPAALPGPMTDPHAVTAGEAGVWVAQAAARSVGRIDPATDLIAESIPLPGVPNALALDGDTLWVTSFEDDRVYRVDLSTGAVEAEIAVPKPTGIVAGLGGVWVVEHRDDALARIDPATDQVVAEIPLGERGPNATCGMCAENVIVSDGSLWVAGNEGRSVIRVDPVSNSVAATIQLPLRVWSVTTGGDAVWASQFEGNDEGDVVDRERWAIARIDPTSNTATAYEFDGAFGVTWAYDSLWIATPGRRGDVLFRLDPDD